MAAPTARELEGGMSSSDVLVVDDDPDFVEVIGILLEQAGYESRGAANGQEALEAVAERVPALILLDMLMPVMDGWKCARALRERYGEKIPIIVISAAEDPRQRAESVGAEYVLPKPFETSELLGLVSKIVAKKTKGGN